MQLHEFLAPERVLFDREARTKAETLDRLVDHVVRLGMVEDRSRLTEAILLREEIVTTGIGGGIAIPHADLPEVAAPVLFLGIFPQGVEFDSLDEDPVDLVFLLLGTPRTPDLHMKILARIARLSKAPTFRSGLCACRSGEEVQAFLRDLESAG